MKVMLMKMLPQMNKYDRLSDRLRDKSFMRMRCQNVKDVKNVKHNLFVLHVEINGIAVENVRYED